ncbi:ATP-binding cassette domain-containing protein [Nocardioides marmoriginsengisoli]|uniref:ATP-binding cassette domain-containing protein n=1 Tax=Nocardioides marmoriginsengisoli TaxID=661483 RepID=A0A3N0CJL5_9ACTN|nr:ABC transporter ATP-binding protein [Nocardioides marmoriginsengisoli]RNL63133.1 ATP-binding cassette domain-containing protein [Nocardioides marmoriginsengisoli]
MTTHDGIAVELAGVSVTYADAAGPVLRDVDLTIEEGELVLVVGRTGSGKSSLLGALNGLVPHFTGGTLTGSVRVHGRDTRDHRPRDLADLVGVVGQDPLAGFVTDTVEEELAYGMEQLGLAPDVMRKRVEETLDLLGIADLRDAALADLSGGQQQRVAIGSVLTAHPRVLVLDEPTSALDPTGAEEVLAAITRLVHDLAVTVVIAEHRVERVLAYADRVVHVVDGRVESGLPAAMMRTSTIAPPVVELGRWAGWEPLPMSVRDAWRAGAGLRRALADAPPARTSSLSRRPDVAGGARPLLSAAKLSVHHHDLVAVREVDLQVHAGSVTALMGRNGSGKSSLLWALQGSGTRTSGTVALAEGGDPADLAPAVRRTRVGLVPQTPADLLYLPTVGEECAQADQETGAAPGTCRALLDRIVPEIDGRLHPRDLSEGQRLALVLAIQLSADPAVLLLDEPTRGLDYQGKAVLAEVLRELAGRGRSILLSTHDVEFVAESADRVLVIAAGEIVADGPTSEVVTSSPAFAPQVAKVLGHGLLTVADAVAHVGEGPR